MAHDIPIRALICDPVETTNNALLDQLERHDDVDFVKCATDIPAAQQLLRADDINTVFIDPIATGLDTASDFIFSVRKTLPEIVFTLYTDLAVSEAKRSDFYRGKRQRFSHYYKLDKSSPVTTFPEEVSSVIRTCQADLSWRLSRESLKRLAVDKKDRKHAKQETLYELERRISDLVERVPANRHPIPKKNAVFLSYRFAETDYSDGLIPLLEARGFTVITGKRAGTSISKAIIDRIRDCEYFLCLMTRDSEKADATYTTSSWLLEEKGVALAFGKQIVLMIEEGVNDFGGLQGDWERIHFAPKGFLKAALEAVEQLVSYSGRGDGDEPQLTSMTFES